MMEIKEATHTTGPRIVMLEYEADTRMRRDQPPGGKEYEFPQVVYTEHDIEVFIQYHNDQTGDDGKVVTISIPQALAAPDLLAACSHVLTRLDAEAESLGGDNPVFVCGGMREELRAAIGKAVKS